MTTLLDILVVLRNREEAEALQEKLERAFQVRVFVAGTISDAIMATRKQGIKIAAAIVDLSMSASGVSFPAHLRDLYGPSFQIVVVSGDVSPLTEVLVMELLPLEWLQRPLEFDALARALRRGFQELA